MRLLAAAAAVVVVAALSACGDAREVGGSEGGGGPHPIPFVAEHTAAARASIASCTGCHGADYETGAAPSCTACHTTIGFADWRTNCTFCHGGGTDGRDASWAGPLAEAAPPQTAAGPEVDPDQTSSNAKVGAHQAHLTAGTFSNPIACASCHAVPPQTFPESFAHVNGTIDVEFSTTARQGVASPGYAGAGGTCAVACHGSTAALGNRTSPAWITTGIACGACHSTAPTTGFHTLHFDQGVQCVSCHPGYSPTTVNLGTHLNGAFEAVVEANPAATPPTTDGSFSSWPTACGSCHPGL